MKLTGGSLILNELMLLLKASYEENADKNILTYELDKKLSNLCGKVYVDNINKKIVLAHRGTGSENMGSDWANNLIYASSSAYKLTSRFKIAKKMVDGALKKYQGYQFESIGHSQGALLSRLLSDKALKVLN